ncbi:MAG: hypothetical protein HY516_03790 [Candidatus Aenigmarchaeota archaeon]|nr:hypothetical protein [Candidatus Aenigmarchaeota archaeon]
MNNDSRKRVLLDTNIYGIIALNAKPEETVEKMIKSGISVIGFDLIRKELRHTPNDIKLDKRSLRIKLLGLYDALTGGNDYKTTFIVTGVAEEYYQTMLNLGVKIPKFNIFNDLLIVACASVNEVDVVVSDDKRTMLSDELLTVYRIVNNIRKLRIPDFIGYDKFRRLFSL